MSDKYEYHIHHLYMYEDGAQDSCVEGLNKWARVGYKIKERWNYDDRNNLFLMERVTKEKKKSWVAEIAPLITKFLDELKLLRYALLIRR